MKNISEELNNMIEWNRAIVFDQALKIKARKNTETNETELGLSDKQLSKKLQ